tara:strand:+ start:2777 stop:4987 length:2211 start_codon:yes stop_codon:yes gene_type:complete
MLLRRNTVWFIGFLLSAAASHTFGLELGSVTVESYLNQPLRLRIEITQVGEVPVDDVTVQMASTDDFVRLGIERTDVLSRLRFQTQGSSTGAYVLLTSNEAITEPFLTFILETRWPNGRSLSEHTAVLALPIYREETAQEDAALRQPLSGIPRALDPRADTSSTLTSGESDQSSSPDRETLEINPRDTLIGIARQILPGESVSLQQTMIAIQSLNPDAFAEGNINRLLSGQVLRLPTEQEIRAINAASAISEVGRQNQEVVDVEPFGVSVQTSSGQRSSAGRLSVVAADSDDIDGSSATASLAAQENAELDRRIAELEAELTLRQEEADRARIDREILELRLADLDAQIEATQELIRLKDIQLAQLRESLALANEAAGAARAEQIAQGAMRSPEAPPSETPSASTSLLSLLLNNPFFLFGGLGFIVLSLVWVMLRRNRSVSMTDSRILEPLVEVEADQIISSRRSISDSQGSEESGSADRNSGDNGFEQKQTEDELDEIVFTGSAIARLPQDDQSEETDLMFLNEDNTAASDGADPFIDDLGIDLDNFDSSIFELEGNPDSGTSKLGNAQETVVSSDEPGLPIDSSGSEGRTDEESERVIPKGTEIGSFHQDRVAKPDKERTSEGEEDSSYPENDNDNTTVPEAGRETDINDLDFFSEEETTGSEISDDEFEESADEVSVLSHDDETATKLELAYAYQKMGDADGAIEILQEVVVEGNESQAAEATKLLEALQNTP